MCAEPEATSVSIIDPVFPVAVLLSNIEVSVLNVLVVLLLVPVALLVALALLVAVVLLVAVA